MRILCLLSAVLLFTDRPIPINGQFPAVCNTPENLNSKRCCPNNCNATSGKGNCIDITNVKNTQWLNSDSSVVDKIENIIPSMVGNKVDSRLRWPTAVFTHVCKCIDPYAGPDCNECIFGRKGDACNKNSNLVRKSIVSMTEEQIGTLSEQIYNAKNSNRKEWAIIVEEPEKGSSGTVVMENVNAYHLFVYLHFMATRDNDGSCKDIGNKNVTVDFAHEGPTFATWHRYYLLLFEREMRKEEDNADFVLPYWDWERDRGLRILKDRYFGSFDSDNTQPNDECLNPKINGSDWITVCDHPFQIQHRNKKTDTVTVCDDIRRLCSVTADLTKDDYKTLCRYGNKKEDNKKEGRLLPFPYELEEALKDQRYEEGTGPWNGNSGAFRNKLEGFVGMNCIESGSGIVTSSAEMGSTEDEPQRALHNQVHLFFSGHLGNVPSASNDPIFFLHHANIDRMFEMWLKKYNADVSAYIAESGGHPGHNLDDWLVPLFPLMTNADMFKRSTNLGYEYESLEVVQAKDCGQLSGDSPTDSPPTTRSSGSGGGSGGGSSGQGDHSSVVHVSAWLIVLTLPLVMLWNAY